MALASPIRWLRSLVPEVLSRAPRSGIAHQQLAPALGACETLRSCGLASSLAYWDGVEQSSLDIAVEYLCAVEQVHRAELQCRVSLKPLALAFRRDLLAKIAARAQTLQVPLQFDSPPAEVADVTYSAIDDVLQVHRAIGCTIPGRWRRSTTDADWAISHGVAVRVVKGEWADPDDPNRDARAGFLEVINQLAGRATHVLVATHDVPLAREALSRLRISGTSCELELLAGRSAERPMAVARELGVAVRFYVPYGDGVLPYHAVRMPRGRRLTGEVRPRARWRLASSRPPWLRSGGRARA
jgi:proline dehydrogenase